MKTLLCLLFTLFFALTNASIINFQASPKILCDQLTQFASMRCSLSDTEAGSQIGRKRDVTSRDVIDSDVIRSHVNRSDIRRDAAITNTTDDILRIVSIIVRRDDGQEVTFASPFDTPTALVDQGVLSVKGDVTGQDSQGYVELTWSDASQMTLGGYECEIQTLDKQHQHRDYTASLEMTSQPPSVSDVIAHFTQENNKQNEDHKKEIDKQNQEIENLKNQNDRLRQCINPHVGFTATFKRGSSSALSLPKGQTAKFDEAIYNTGGAYSPSTGLFTCNVAGMYNFQVNTNAFTTHYSNLQLQLNSQPITTAAAVGYSSAEYQDAWKSASTSAVLNLNQGDVVRVVPTIDSTINNTPTGHIEYHSNSFTGNLIQAAECFA